VPTVYCIHAITGGGANVVVVVVVGVAVVVVVVVGGKQGDPCIVASGWVSVIKGTPAHITTEGPAGPTSIISGTTDPQG
jgi:hypothetical protein